jgi:polyphosphate kinase 2 (PPK2 family)
MAISLSDYEDGPKHKGDYDEALAALQARLVKVQVAHIVHRRRAIVMFEGWDAGGKDAVIQRMTEGWDPRHFRVWPIGVPTEQERDHHFLWRFWSKLPGLGEIAVFDRSWYGRVLVERIEGLATEKEWRRGYDEINEFEAQQKDSGTTLVKVFLHITGAEQDERLKARIEDPWKRWKIGPDDLRARDRRADYTAAIEDMFRFTDTRWAPWKVIDGTHKKYARLAVLEHVASVLEKAVPMTPPALDAETAKQAAARYGMEMAEG